MKTYDYIIVGAGSAGCVLANRLSENASASVLVLEAGPADRSPWFHIPLGVGKLFRSGKYDWGYQSEPEPYLEGRRIDFMRGKVLGGSSSVNMLVYTRGNAGDFDRWAQKGAPGWSFADVLPFFKHAETWEKGGNAVRGGDGPVGVVETKTRDPLSDAWLAAIKAYGYSENSEPASGNMEGFGRTQFTIRNGRRSSAATAYLKPALKRANLHLKTSVHATRIIMNGTRAVGIEYVKENGACERIEAAREVILCGGAINSPQLLMLSGIGPAAHLTDMGIKVVADLPVGQNLQDHPSVLTLYGRKEPSEFQRGMRFDRITLNMVRAYLFGTGPATMMPSGLLGFVKTRPELELPDIELILPFAPPYAEPWFPGIKKPYIDAFGVRAAVLRPESRGEILLRSSDPLAPVRIRGNFFSAADDLELLRRAFEIGRDVALHPALDPYRGQEIMPGGRVRSSAEIDDYIRKTMITLAHPACTCPMGLGSESVLDPQMRVRGVERLRVVDASAMPDLVSAHLNATVLMIGEKAADLIIRDQI
ncbi:MAG TPA: GMC family oxidoreductase N-terminal domain-containing protein [Methylomirabilota bacterium]|nr:GMC family oxidoreductase N-terminal domain-containing protein [Methylomirabilota bacterium]